MRNYQKELEKIKAEKKQEKAEDAEEKSEPKKLSNNRKAKVSVKTNKNKKK